MKILVTGANGFMGHGIIKELSESGNEIVVSDFTDFTYGYKNVSSVAGNLFEIENPFEHFGKPDVLVHPGQIRAVRHLVGECLVQVSGYPLRFCFGMVA